jgi:hypothetical protein
MNGYTIYVCLSDSGLCLDEAFDELTCLDIGRSLFEIPKNLIYN